MHAPNNANRLEPLEPRRLLSAALAPDPSFAGDGRLEFDYTDAANAGQVGEILVSESAGGPIYAIGRAGTRDYPDAPFETAGPGTPLQRPALENPVVYVARLGADGGVLGTDILDAVAPTFRSYGDFKPAPGGGFFGSRIEPAGQSASGFDEFTVRRFTDGLQVDSSFAPVTFVHTGDPSYDAYGVNAFGNVAPGDDGIDYSVRADGGVTVAEFGGSDTELTSDAADALARLTRFGPTGQQLGQFVVSEAALPLASPNAALDPNVQRFRHVAALDDGGHYLAFSGNAFASGSFGEQGGVVRLDADGGVDAAFATGGIFYSDDDIDGAVTLRAFEADRDGRFGLYNSKDDAEGDLYLFDGAEVTQVTADGPGGTFDFNNRSPAVLDFAFPPDGSIAYLHKYAAPSQASLIYDTSGLSGDGPIGSPGEDIFGLTAVSRFVPGGGFDQVALQDGPGGPAEAFALAVAPDGGLLAGGFTEAAEATDAPGSPRLYTALDPATPTVWKFLPASGDGGADVLIDFEDASGPLLNTYESTGFVLKNASPTKSLAVLGPAQGYASTVLRPENWGETIVVERADGAAFGIDSLDYASDQWAEAGDLRVIGIFAAGGFDAETVSFDSTALATLDLNWTGLSQLRLDWGDGANATYGVVDNLALTGGDDAGGGTTLGDVGYTFDDLTVGDVLYKAEAASFNVFARTPDGTLRSDLRVLAAGDGAAVRAVGEGDRVRITRDQDQPFDLASLDYAGATDGAAGDFTVVGRFADGSTQSAPIDFAGDDFQRLTLSWQGLVRVDVRAAGGVNGQTPVIDNLDFAPVASNVIDFEGTATGVYDTLPPGIFADGNAGPSELVVYGPSAGYASNVLSTAEWGDAIRINFAGNGATVESLDLLAGRWGEAGDAVIRGVGALFDSETTAGFGSTVVLGWTNVQILEIDFGGGVNEAYGAIDNVTLVS